MTFKEILQRNVFESIVPFLTKGVIREYKEAYDEICRQPDVPGSQNISVAMGMDDKGETRMIAYGLDVETLEPNANKNVIVDLPDGYSEAEMCFSLLRQAVRYGHTTRVKKRYLEELSDPFVRMNRALCRKAYAHYLPKYLRKELNHGGKMTAELRMICYKRKAKRNKTKKKRDQRIERRLLFLHCKGIRKLTVDWFVATSADRPATSADLSLWNVSRENRIAFSHTLLHDVYNAEYVSDFTFQSHTMSEEGRLTYILDLMRYFPSPFHLHGWSVLSVAVQTSTTSPITEEEGVTLTKLIETLTKNNDLELGWVVDTYDDTLGFDMEIKLLLT